MMMIIYVDADNDSRDISYASIYMRYMYSNQAMKQTRERESEREKIYILLSKLCFFSF
jgi:hypothetical protein